MADTPYVIVTDLGQVWEFSVCWQGGDRNYSGVEPYGTATMPSEAFTVEQWSRDLSRSLALGRVLESVRRVVGGDEFELRFGHP